MLTTVVLISLFFLGIAVLIALYRLIRGKSVADRIMALDAIGINIIAIVALLAILEDTRVYLDIILVIGILSFLGTVALCRFIERGVVIESRQDD